MPDLALENRLGGLVCGIDEAGRGPLAGPVVAAAVIWHGALPDGLDDSKQLSFAQRAALFERITAQARFGIGEATVEEIDRLNILQATKLAMVRAYEALGVACHAALIDGNQPPSLPCRTQAVIGGDGLSASIAAASILAKVTRDRLMHRLHDDFPLYGFIRHVGYGTAEHRAALAAHGPCPLHRRSFAPVRDWHAA